MKKNNHSLEKNKGQVWMYIVLILYSAFTVFVLSWIFISSLKTNKEFVQNIWSFPKSFNLQNYEKAWNVVNMKRFFGNSVFIVIAAVILIDVLCAPAAYILGRKKFKLKGSINILFLVGLGIPIPIILIPVYKIFLGLNLIDNMLGLIIVYIVISLPFTIFLLTGFMRSLPIEMEEAAIVDGCTPFGAFWRIMLPLSSPGIVAASLLNFITLWNEYLLALTFITRENNRPLSLGLYSLKNAMLYTSDWTGLFAGVMIVTIPTIILFLFLSERIMTAMTLGAVKG